MREEYIKYLRKVGRQEVMAFLYGMGFTHTEIADLFNVSRPTVYYNINTYKEKVSRISEEGRFLER